MRTKDWIYQQLKEQTDEIPALIQALDSTEDLDKEKCVSFLKQVLESTVKIYHEAFNDALALVEQVDKSFLNREIPPHLK